MKKNLFLSLSLLAMAGLWTGCSNDESVEAPVNQNAISFRLQGSTPDLRTTGTTKDYINAFVVYANDSIGGAVANESLFDGITVARQVDKSFDYNPKKMYSKDATSAGFFAYSPVSIYVTNQKHKAADGGALTFYYENQIPNTSGNTTQEDLLFAYAWQKGGAPLVGSVRLDFRHALSRVFVTATNSTASNDVKIESLVLVNLKNEGTFNVLTEAWTPSGGLVDLPYALAPSGVVIKAKTNVPTLLTSKEQGMLIIPQEATNTGDYDKYDTNDFALYVKYSIANLKDQEERIVIAETGSTGSAGNPFVFEVNKQYAININFSGNEITFTVDVKDFDDGLSGESVNQVP